LKAVTPVLASLFAIVLLVMPVWSTASAQPRPRPRPDEVSGGPSSRVATTTRPSVQETAAEQRAAMLSVVYHVRAPRDSAPPRLRPIPLPEAARILSKPRDPFAESRRRRAIVKLGPHIERREVRAALEVLDAPIDAIIDVLRAPRPQTLHDAERSIFKLLNAGGSAVPGCQHDGASTLTETNPTSLEAACASGVTDLSGITQVTTTIVVHRPLSVMSPIMDPQNWDECSDYFDATYVAQALADQAQIDPSTHDATRHPGPPQPASAWKELLFEHFLIDWDEIPGVLWPLSTLQSSFRNVLSVESLPTAGKYDVTYCLHESVWSQIGLDTTAGGIDVDEGHSSAVDDGTKTEIEGVKYLRFEGNTVLGVPYDAMLNAMVPSVLEAMGGELEEAVCCQLPPQPPLSPPVLLP
jgi:hypothetical protein